MSIRGNATSCLHSVVILTPFIEMEQLDVELPSWLIDEVAAIIPSHWFEGRSKYRHCRSVYFGKADGFNRRRMEFAAGSAKYPRLQKKIVNWIKAVAPGMVFNRIVINQYAVGESMGGHVDGNDTEHPISVYR